MNKILLAPADAAGGAPHGREPFAAFVLDDASRQAVIKAANEQGWTGARVSDGGVVGAIETLGDAPTPRVLLIDISDSTDPVRDINRLAEVCVEGTHVVALGAVNEVDLFRRLIHAGVDDYLVKPIDSDALNKALTRLMRERTQHREPSAPGRLVVVIGVRGGIGASALTSNLAWLSAHEHHSRTALVDLDLQFGSAALGLDIEPGRGLVEALRNPERIDDLLLERASVRVDDELSVFCAEEPLETMITPDSAAIEMLVNRLRGGFETIFVELPRNMAPANHWLIASADFVLIVADYTLLAARDCPRLLKCVREASPQGRVMVIANRVGSPSHRDIKRQDMEKALDAKVDIEIPQDAKGAVDSTQAGKPMVVAARRGKASAAMHELAQQICLPGETAKAPLWRRLLGKGA